ncbi:hypothetical protein KPH14_000721 [Odynerus spinipes]|uniref:Uncharacterized protein n=1 Tax=Odynerus spinipes TaxID=1348599 RepID=A0AAD9RF83_9HYME|nr:hypothetical protein KPH14_000721 [Odynerus spinipes]
MPAEKCDEVLRAKLLMFNLHYRDLVGITTDGASVMKKFGHLVPMIQQLCSAHGIQLAVVEVLYGKVISAIELQVDEERNTTKDASDDEILHVYSLP